MTLHRAVSKTVLQLQVLFSKSRLYHSADVPKKQSTIALSTAEAERVALSHAVHAVRKQFD